jgi:hypothetical protein
VYLCTYEPQDTVFARHFLTGISTCKPITHVDEEFVRKTLEESHVHRLLEQGEVVIVDPSHIDLILSSIHYESEEETALYAYIRVKRASR